MAFLPRQRRRHLCSEPIQKHLAVEALPWALLSCTKVVICFYAFEALPVNLRIRLLWDTQQLMRDQKQRQKKRSSPRGGEVGLSDISLVGSHDMDIDNIDPVPLQSHALLYLLYREVKACSPCPHDVVHHAGMCWLFRTFMVDFAEASGLDPRKPFARHESAEMPSPLKHLPDPRVDFTVSIRSGSFATSHFIRTGYLLKKWNVDNPMRLASCLLQNACSGFAR